MDSNNTETYACFLCEVSGLTSSAMKKHIEEFHSAGCSSSQNLCFECIFCDFKAESGYKIQCHITAEHSEQNICPFCDLNCGDSGGLSSHLNIEHTPSLLKVYSDDHVDHHDHEEKIFRNNHESCEKNKQTTNSEQIENGIEVYNAFETDVTDPNFNRVSDTSLRLTDCPCGSRTELEIQGQKFQIIDAEANEERNDVLFTKETIKSSQRSGTQCNHTKSSSSLPMESCCTVGVDLATIDSDENTASQKLEDNFHGGAPLGNEAVLKPSLASNQHRTFAPSISKETAPIVYSTGVPGSSKHEDSPLYDCPLCPFQTVSEGQIVQHFNSEHNFSEDGASSDADFVNPLLYSCPMCCTGFDSPKDLSNHVDKNHLDESQQENISQGQTHRVSKTENVVNGNKKKNLDQHSGKRSSADSTSSHRKEPLECLICGIVMDHEDQNLMAEHVDKHFQSSSQEDFDWQFAQKLQSEEQQRVQIEANQLEQQKTKYGMNTRLTAKQQFDQDLERTVSAGRMTVSEFLERKTSHTKSSQSGVDDGYTRVTGIIEKLMTYYVSGSCPRNVSRTYLCSPLHHYSTSYGDRGWGCGYRNFQMLLSCLMTDATYLSILFNGQPKMPSILKLQQLIENAWKEGFDPHGSMQLEGRVVNTRKWIGTTEIVAALSSLHIKCQVLDFSAPSGKDNTHPVMINWVRAYFKDSSNFKPPLYLQHQGHSRTIIGVEELHNGSGNLLLFDPGTQRSRMELFHGKIVYNTMQTIRRGLHAFRAPQYQIVSVVGLLKDAEFQAYKIIRSERLS